MCIRDRHAQELVCILNKGPTAVSWDEFGYVCGFGPGTFKLIEDSGTVPVGAVEYSLSGLDETVLRSNVGISIKDLVAEQHEKYRK